MKTNLIIFLLMLLCNTLLCYWCCSLERNYQALYQELNDYKSQSVEKNECQDKEIRILKQDVLILQKGWK